MNSAQIWQQKLVPRWAWWLVWSLLAIVGLVSPLVVKSDSGTPYVVEVLVYVLAWGIPLWIAALAMWSANVYGAISVSSTVVRVGRETLSLETIDRDWVRQLASETPGLADRLRALGMITNVHRTLPAGGGHLLGGAYGAPAGSQAVTLRLLDGRRVTVATRDRAGFLGALLTALG